MMTFTCRLKGAAWLVLGTLVLGGCSESADIGELRQRINDIRTQPRGRIEPPPEFKAIASYTYSAHMLREPFRARVDVEEAQQGKQVEPDFSRRLEYLEDFSFDTLKMVGTLSRPGEPLQALILDATGQVSRVVVGNYLGKNHGRITALDDRRVAVLEIIPDGRGGWVERQRVIVLSE